MKRIMLLTILSISLSNLNSSSFKWNKVSSGLGIATGLFYFTESAVTLGESHSLEKLQRKLKTESPFSMSLLDKMIQQKEKQRKLSVITMLASAYLIKICYDKYPVG